MWQNHTFGQLGLKILDVRVSLNHIAEDFGDGVSEGGGGEEEISNLFFVVLTLLVFD